jgi:hypothetical protein
MKDDFVETNRDQTPNVKRKHTKKVQPVQPFCRSFNEVVRNVAMYVEEKDLKLQVEQIPGLVRNWLRQNPTNYRNFFVSKRGGGQREVSAPRPLLKMMQRWLMRWLYEIAPAAEAAHGFVKKKGNWTLACELAAKMKTSRRFSVLTQDFKGAFQSVTEDQVRSLFRDNGMSGFQLQSATRIATHNGILATGAPSSPHIFNMLLREVDAKMSGWARKHGGLYVRYADDVTIILPTWRTAKMREAREILRRLSKSVNLELHPEKTRITRLNLDSPSAEVVGIAVSHKQATRPRRLRRKLRGLVRAGMKRVKTNTEESLEQAEHILQRCAGLASYFSGGDRAMIRANNVYLRKMRFSTA